MWAGYGCCGKDGWNCGAILDEVKGGMDSHEGTRYGGSDGVGCGRLAVSGSGYRGEGSVQARLGKGGMRELGTGGSRGSRWGKGQVDRSGSTA